jgi:hypothetical protein
VEEQFKITEIKMNKEKKQKVFELLQDEFKKHDAILQRSQKVTDLIANILDEEEPEETLEEKFERVWNENIMPMCCSQVFIDSDGKETTTPTPRIEVLDSNRDWLFDYNYDPEALHFWISLNRVWPVLRNKVSYKYEEIRKLIEIKIEEQFKINGVEPELYLISKYDETAKKFKDL